MNDDKLRATHVEFIKNELINLIIAANDDLKDHTVVSCTVEPSVTLDGFMSYIYKVSLVINDTNNDKQKTHDIIVKLIKAQGEHADIIMADVQCYNEIVIYKTVLSYYEKFLKSKGVQFGPLSWCPRVYYADHQIYKGLGDQKEYILAIENLSPSGYRLGPKVSLNKEHLLLMAKTIAQYHAVSYAIKITDEKTFKNLSDAIKPFNFFNEDSFTMFDIVYPAAMKRLFGYYYQLPKEERMNEDFEKTIDSLKKKYEDHSTVLMQKFLEQDEVFSVINHGDFNRNNVMFLYDSEEGYENPQHLKMFDFQQVRYGSPAIDLSFFMFMNMAPEIRAVLWDQLLIYYHESMIDTLSEILGCDKSDSRLKPYSLENFLKHFSEFAFYGAMIAIHFLPFMNGSPEDLMQIQSYISNDKGSPEAMALLMRIGGIKGKEAMMDVAKFAFEKGYMKFYTE